MPRSSPFGICVFLGGASCCCAVLGRASISITCLRMAMQPVSKPNGTPCWCARAILTGCCCVGLQARSMTERARAAARGAMSNVRSQLDNARLSTPRAGTSQASLFFSSAPSCCWVLGGVYLGTNRQAAPCS